MEDDRLLVDTDRISTALPREVWNMFVGAIDAEDYGPDSGTSGRQCSCFAVASLLIPTSSCQLQRIRS
eukprot:6423615-Amphidinium_carterae.1